MKPETWGSFSPRLQIPITVFILETAQFFNLRDTEQEKEIKKERKKKDEEHERKKEKCEEKRRVAG